MTDDTVTVPHELLRQVLDQADEDSEYCQSLVGTPANAHRYEADRARIAELRRAAGMEEDHG